MTKSLSYLLIIIIGIHFHCRSGSESEQLEMARESFINVYVELQEFKERYPQFIQIPLDSSQAILDKYKFTQDDYDKTVAAMKENPEEWETFYKEVLARLQEKDPQDTNSHSSEKKQ